MVGCGTERDLCTGPHRAGDGHHGGRGVLDDPATGVAVAGHHVEGAGRQELRGDLGHQERGLRGGVARLEDDRVAGRERGGDLPHRHHHRVVPRRHLPDDSDRLAADPRRVAGHVLTSGATLQHPGGTREEAELVHHRRHLLARGEGVRLAGVLGLEVHEVVGPALDRVGEVEQRLLALGGRRTTPLAEGAVGGLVGGVDVVGSADRCASHDPAGGGVDHLGRLVGARVDVGAADEVAQAAWGGHRRPPDFRGSEGRVGRLRRYLHR